MDIIAVIEGASQGRDFHLLLGDFLDEFYRSDAFKQQEMINKAPARHEKRVPCEYLAYLAATAHKLANDYQLDVPKWVFDSKYYLHDRPYFAGNVEGNLRLLFMYFSPPEFKHRNLFVDANALTRV